MRVHAVTPRPLHSKNKEMIAVSRAIFKFQVKSSAFALVLLETVAEIKLYLFAIGIIVFPVHLLCAVTRCSRHCNDCAAPAERYAGGTLAVRCVKREFGMR